MVQAKRKTGLDPLGYMGVEPNTPTKFTVQKRDPTTRDYSNWNIGAEWLNELTEVFWKLVNKDANVATWIKCCGSGVNLKTLTGDTGGIVGSSSDNINIFSGLSALSIDGNPATNTLTINSDGTIATQYDTDIGSAAAVGGILNIVGGTGIDVTGAGDTVTVALSGTSVISTLTGNSGGPISPVANNIDILGGNVITAVGTVGTITLEMDNGTDGQVLIGGGSDPSWGNITSTGGTVSITEGSNTINLESIGPSGVSAFSASLSATQLNVTGDGTRFYFIADTELFDIASDYDSTTGIFTAPITGNYSFGSSCSITGHVINGISIEVGIEISTGADYRLTRDEAESEVITYQTGGSIFIALTAAQTVKPYVTAAGTTKTVDVAGGTSPFETYFYGNKL